MRNLKKNMDVVGFGISNVVELFKYRLNFLMIPKFSDKY